MKLQSWYSLFYICKGGPGKETPMYNSQHTAKFEFSRPQLRVRPWGRQSSGVKPKLANLVTVTLIWYNYFADDICYFLCMCEENG